MTRRFVCAYLGRLKVTRGRDTEVQLKIWQRLPCGIDVFGRPPEKNAGGLWPKPPAGIRRRDSPALKGDRVYRRGTMMAVMAVFESQ